MIKAHKKIAMACFVGNFPLNVCMYVCAYAGMHERMQARMHACMLVYQCASMDSVSLGRGGPRAAIPPKHKYTLSRGLDSRSH